MNKTPVAGAGPQIVGGVKPVLDTQVGDARLPVDARTDQVAARVGNAVGGAQDTVRR